MYFSYKNIPLQTALSSCLHITTYPLSHSIQRQRTVYRLTLVKQWNTDELDAYASLVSKGTPDFIEIKVIDISSEHTVSVLADCVLMDFMSA